MTTPQNPIVAGLQQVLAAQHACIFGYPAIGTHLDLDAQINQARADEAAHRLTRDRVAAQVVALGATPVAADASYSSPVELDAATSGQQWAVALEERAASAYRYLLLCCVQAGAPTNAPVVASQLALRKQAIAGLAAAALAAGYWRRLASPGTPTVPFPGS